jgi:hypothetical protein
MLANRTFDRLIGSFHEEIIGFGLFVDDARLTLWSPPTEIICPDKWRFENQRDFHFSI